MDKHVLVGGKRAVFDFGRRVVETLTAVVSLNAADTGILFLLNLATGFTVTLPAAEDAGAGWNCELLVIIAPSSGTYILTEKTADDTNVLVVNGITEGEVDTGDDAPYNAGCTTVTFADGVAVIGDRIQILCDGTNFFVKGHTNADGGVTLA